MSTSFIIPRLSWCVYVKSAYDFVLSNSSHKVLVYINSLSIFGLYDTVIKGGHGIAINNNNASFLTT